MTVKNKTDKTDGGTDLLIIILPLLIIVCTAVLLLLFPKASQKTIELLRLVFVNKLGFFYIVLGLGMVVTAVWLAFSEYGRIKLGGGEKPAYSNFAWGSMIFTSTMAADILYWSLIEWAYYYNSSPFGLTNLSFAAKQDWASAYPLFHWGITPWAFYLVPAAAFGYMLHVRGRTTKTFGKLPPRFGHKSRYHTGQTYRCFFRNRPACRNRYDLLACNTPVVFGRIPFNRHSRKPLFHTGHSFCDCRHLYLGRAVGT